MSQVSVSALSSFIAVFGLVAIWGTWLFSGVTSLVSGMGRECWHCLAQPHKALSWAGSRSLSKSCPLHFVTTNKLHTRLSPRGILHYPILPCPARKNSVSVWYITFIIHRHVRIILTRRSPILNLIWRDEVCRMYCTHYIKLWQTWSQCNMCANIHKSRGHK